MKAVIIEDEKIAAELLKNLICQLDENIEVVTVLQTVEDSVEWLNSNQHPDILFVDIHLADGSSFSIFEKTEVKCPIVFTTAYDEYALKAFEVNSIDYLLKPINKDDLQRALNKYKNLKGEKHEVDYKTLISRFLTEAENVNNYKEHFLVPERDKLVPLAAKDIAYVYIDLKLIKAVTFSGKVYYLNQNLDEMMNQLNPKMFFRANRQYIVSHEAIKDVSIWFGNKISLNLTIPTEEKIIVSKARVSDFKNWYSF
ncbi:MAG: response regulator transcription factor [Bacteroidales bacterium]|nr:response regulator transcription factor [Bacteroidales bacterium]